MADSPMHKPAGPHETAPSAEDFDRLAALIKPSWELEDAPFSMGNRSLTPHEWEQLRGEPTTNGEPASSPSHASHPSSPPRNGAASRASNGVAAPAAPPVAQARTSVPDDQARGGGEVARPARVSAPPVFPEPSTSQSRALREAQPRSEIAVAVDAPAGRSRDWQKTSLADEIDPYPAERSRKGLYVGLAAAAVAILAGVFFATRSSEPETSPAPGAPGAATPTEEKAPSVSNARVDTPPPSQTTAPAAATAKEAPAAKEPAVAKEQPAAKEPASAKEPAGSAPREHTSSRPAQQPRTAAPPPPHNAAPAPAPSPKASSKGTGNASGGIVRDVPF